MSKIFANSADINKSPLNLSKTKQLYSFTKSARFDPIKLYADRIYDTSSMLSLRATTLGFGDRLLRNTASTFCRFLKRS